jgi:hypothetical protein
MAIPGEPASSTDWREYRVYGVEHVYDALDEYEHGNPLDPVSLRANSVVDALDQAAQALQSAVNVARQGFMASGTFSVEVIRVVDSKDYCIFQNSRGLRRYFGGQLEDASIAWADQKDVPFVSCFLSYNRRDEAFTRQLYNDLSRLRLSCWFAPIDLRTDHLERALTHAIENTDKMLVVLSEHSLSSHWVAFEAERALAKEQAAGTRLLFPILLDQAAVHSELSWVRGVHDRGYGLDFSDWQDTSAYGRALDALVAGFTQHL